MGVEESYTDSPEVIVVVTNFTKGHLQSAGVHELKA